MSSKEVKNLLKEAREAIKSKEYQVAIKRCKEAIQLDKKNGMSYILLGAAYQETDKTEAAKYLKQAMQLSDDCKLLALQGLANCSTAQDLPAVLEELLVLVPDKYTDYYTKLSNLVNQLNDHRQLIKIFCNEIKVANDDRKYQALKHLLNIFMKNREIANEEYKDEFLECLEIGIQDESHVYHIEIYQNYFKLLHQKGRLDELVKAAEGMTLIYGNNSVPLEYICKVYIENETNESFRVNEALKSNFGIYVERLLELNANSVLGLTASAFVKYAIGDLTTSRDILTKVNQLQPNWQTCLRKLSLIHYRLRAFLLTELVLKQMKDKSLTLAEVLIAQQVEGKVKEGLEICRGFSELKSLELMARGNIYLRNFDEACAIIKDLNSNGVNTQMYEGLIHRFNNQYEKAIEVIADFESHEAFLEIGRNYFMLQKFDESLMNILKATKLDPNNSECFYWLGKIYLATNDETRSKKCFEKCLNQNPQNVECISILSAIYRKNKDWDNNLHILENSVKSVADGAYQKSAFFQLGLHHLGQHNFDNAVTAFRNSLRYDSKNAECWEALADGYFARGSYNSSLKVFEKSVVLNPENIYAKLQIARIKFVLQQYQESIGDYEEILSSNHDYLPGLKGIAESHFGRAYYLHDNHRTGRARDHCQQALHYVEKALKFEPTFQCLWRLLGNIFEFVGSLPEAHNQLTIPGEIICEEKEKKLSKHELLELASKCYWRCLKINKENDYVWFNLVANYYRRSLSQNEGQNEFLKLAYEGAKYLVKLKPSKWQNWNLLGIICATKEIDNPALAQHCFIKAITLDKKTYTSWSNLGVFYLQQGDIKLANKAFSRAQQSDTSFLNAWIGQAWIADIIGDRDEAMDLFRHCTQLGFHYESSIGYPNFVCSVLNEPDYTSIPKYEYAIDKMHAVSLALDNAVWHCLLESEATFEAWSYVGYLSKCQKLYKQAITAYKKAVEISSGPEKDQCLIDLGFCYLKINENQEAAKTFSNVKEATFQSTIGLALAFYKAGSYQECYETYQKAVEWLATSDEEKGLVLVAMAAMVYAFQGAEDAKIVLFQCIGLSPPPVEGLLSLCSIGLLHKDKQLTELVTKELKNYERDPKYGHHVCFMMAQFYIQYASKADAISYISTRIHEFPDRPHLRKLLALTLMDNYKEEDRLMRAACRMAESSLVLRITHKDVFSSQEAAGILALASCAIESVDRNAAKVLAQKAVHICPLYHKMLK